MESKSRGSYELCFSWQTVSLLLSFLFQPLWILYSFLFSTEQLIALQLVRFHAVKGNDTLCVMGYGAGGFPANHLVPRVYSITPITWLKNIYLFKTQLLKPPHVIDCKVMLTHLTECHSINLMKPWWKIMTF